VKHWILCVFCLLLSAANVAAQDFTVIAHRGASGYLPEHTLEAATLAHSQGADFIEQDLVVSKDDHLVILHDIHLDTVTDVATKYPSRHRDDGRFYAIDFTLAELKTLRVMERQDTKGNQVFSNRYHGSSHFTIATFEEQLELIGELNRLTGKHVGVYPEIKSPAWHRNEGKDISVLTLTALRRHDLDRPDANIYVQCFDFEEIKRLRTELNAKVKLVQLLAVNSWHESTTDYEQLTSPAGLKELKEYTLNIGPWLGNMMMVTPNAKPTLTDWIKQAQDEGFTIHPYTFRMDALPDGITANELLSLLVSWKLAGVFTDQVPPVKAFLAQQ
jgi:glycerophosphoryl diester phosphodiesterase